MIFKTTFRSFMVKRNIYQHILVISFKIAQNINVLVLNDTKVNPFNTTNLMVGDGDTRFIAKCQ